MEQKDQKLPTDSYMCIQAFMINDLHLKGVEKEVYALIYGFSQDGHSEFSGSLSYIQKWVTASKPTVIKAIDYLVTKGLIIKVSDTRNPKSCNHYKINYEVISGLKDTKPTSKEALPVKNEEENDDVNFTSKNTLLVESACQNLLKNFTSKNIEATSKNSLPVTSKETLPNNINNNINNINSNSSMDNLTFSIPTREEVLKYAKTFGENLYIDGDYFYYHNDKHNWKDNNGCQIRNWKALFNNWNQLQKQKAQAKEKAEEELKRQANEKYDQLKAQKEKEQREYHENAIKNTHLNCPKCGSTYPNPEIDYLLKDNVFHCKRCNVSWSATNTSQTLNKQAC